MTNTAQMILEQFFSAFGKGDFATVTGLFDSAVKVHIVREDERRTGSGIYGSYSGAAGVQAWMTNLATVLDFKLYVPDHIVGNETIAFAKGRGSYLVKSSGQPFDTFWMTQIEVADGKITTFRYAEDAEYFRIAQAG